ncbi:MAG: hypothetical protein KKE62_10545 [Proteobacteria bacterium]|nr:hypothetical protein [Pseudomonadota bacterium]MBU1386654.1 hypothetical protein [Pseudomonadota bacterium]MBU1543265.1 hypothetical protein [Pseudomonadota bacterium]MBU2430543.1 hypothetical protein [Pseudomonadota bacterium]MBU2482177.1 hypothetical protein [Pseudomonadota bacterium]
MLNRYSLVIMALLSGLLMLAFPAAAGQADYMKQFKPVHIKPALSIPSADTVKEIGGIRYGQHVDVKLADGTTVRCFPAATKDPEKKSGNYYYLPANPRIAKDKDGTPKFSMVRFVTDKTKDAGGTEGAIIHFLVEYGLTPEQQTETEKLLKQKEKGALLKGAVPLEVGAEGNSFNVVSATLNDKGFTSTLVTTGKAPVMEGQQVAVAARLDAYGATLLAKSLEQPTTDISVVFDLKYVVKLPAYDVQVKINYDKYHEIEKEYTESRQIKTKTRKYWDPKWYNPLKISTGKTTTITEEEQTQALDFLQETGVVSFDYVQHVPDADKEIVESGLHKIVLESFFDMQKRLGEPTEEELSDEGDSDADKSAAEARRKAAAKAKNYSYTVFQRKEIQRKSTQTLSLKKVIARYEHHTMTGNVGTWYAKYKNNPKLVAEVNLDDPFFQRREMRFVIDNEAYDIFKEMVNYATVQVRVPRKDQRPFIDELTIDKKYLEANGQTAVLSYARMGDDKQVYDYAVQWSLRGGHLYPREPNWTKGELMAVTLSAPVVPVMLEAEADLDELSELGVARVSVELRYNQFGKQNTDSKGLSLSPAAGEAVVNKVIYRDTRKDAIEYRLIYHHKKLGKIESDEWNKVEGNYIYCAPTEILLNKVKSLL